MWEKILEIPQTLTITPEWVDLGEDLYGITIRESENQATIQINNSFDWLYDLA